MKKTMVLVFVLLSMASVATAQLGEQPLLSMQRFSFAAGLNHDWYAGNNIIADHEWSVGAYAAYNLTPRLSLTGSSVYGQDTEQWRSTFGLRVHLFGGVD